jgi:CBS domain containing-hemolysin-like protein
MSIIKLIIITALILTAVYFIGTATASASLNARAVNYLYEQDMRGDIMLNDKAINALQAINK